ncbi:hypothetical protein HYR99_38930 [Candidatus Poribacteria bacterium]|nr:hypothetical protein [Candidatus Poribacteria bacterium]
MKIQQRNCIQVALFCQGKRVYGAPLGADGGSSTVARFAQAARKDCTRYWSARPMTAIPATTTYSRQEVGRVAGLPETAAAIRLAPPGILNPARNTRSVLPRSNVFWRTARTMEYAAVATRPRAMPIAVASMGSANPLRFSADNRTDDGTNQGPDWAGDRRSEGRSADETNRLGGFAAWPGWCGQKCTTVVAAESPFSRVGRYAVEMTTV